MHAEFSHFGLEAPAADGLFFALFPDPETAAKLHKTAQQLCIRHRLFGRVFAPEPFHVSLLGLGAHAGLPPGLVAGAIEAAKRVTLPSPFEVRFDRAVSFAGKQRPLVLCSEDDVPELIALQRGLGSAAQHRGIARAKPQYTPHITMLYDERGVEDHAIEPVCWTVREFVLVHSLKGQGRYVPLGRWPLPRPRTPSRAFVSAEA